MKKNRGDYSDIFDVSSFISKENHVLMKEGNTQEKVVLVEPLDGIERWYWKLKGFSKTINEECGNLKVVVNAGEFTRNIPKRCFISL